MDHSITENKQIATNQINGSPERRSMMKEIITKTKYKKENYKLHDRNKYILKQKT